MTITLDPAFLFAFGVIGLLLLGVLVGAALLIDPAIEWFRKITRKRP